MIEPQAAGCLKIFQEHASSIGERVELDQALGMCAPTRRILPVILQTTVVD
jgi:hypothetical protein